MEVKETCRFPIIFFPSWRGFFQKDRKQKCSWSHLSLSLIIFIFSFLDEKDLKAISCVCRAWNTIVQRIIGNIPLHLENRGSFGFFGTFFGMRLSIHEDSLIRRILQDNSIQMESNEKYCDLIFSHSFSKSHFLNKLKENVSFNRFPRSSEATHKDYASIFLE